MREAVALIQGIARKKRAKLAFRTLRRLLAATRILLRWMRVWRRRRRRRAALCMQLHVRASFCAAHGICTHATMVQLIGGLRAAHLRAVRRSLLRHAIILADLDERQQREARQHQSQMQTQRQWPPQRQPPIGARGGGSGACSALTAVAAVAAPPRAFSMRLANLMHGYLPGRSLGRSHPRVGAHAMPPVRTISTRLPLLSSVVPGGGGTLTWAPPVAVAPFRPTTTGLRTAAAPPAGAYTAAAPRVARGLDRRPSRALIDPVGSAPVIVAPHGGELTTEATVEGGAGVAASASVGALHALEGGGAAAPPATATTELTLLTSELQVISTAEALRATGGSPSMEALRAAEVLHTAQALPIAPQLDRQSLSRRPSHVHRIRQQPHLPAGDCHGAGDGEASWPLHVPLHAPAAPVPLGATAQDCAPGLHDAAHACSAACTATSTATGIAISTDGERPAGGAGGAVVPPAAPLRVAPPPPPQKRARGSIGD